MKTLKTIIHTYNYDISNPEDLAAYDALKAKLKGLGLKCFVSYSSVSYHLGELVDTPKVELETTFIYDNQWNTAKTGTIHSKRIFDWMQESNYACGSPKNKKGYWLEQTEEMREARSKTLTCGYCGKHYGIHHEPAPLDLVCNACIDNEYLEIKDLPRLYLLPVSANRDDKQDKEIITKLLPRYKRAQLHGVTERSKQRIEAKRAELETKYKDAIYKAETEFRGFTWLMDNGINTDNVIYYGHTNIFCFGWRGNGISKELESDLLDVISEFPFPYEIKCEDGRKLSAT